MARIVLYELGPHDWWGGWIDLAKHQVSKFADDHLGNEAAELTQQVDRMLAAAKSLSTKHGWEGDMIQGPFLSAIPNHDNAIELALGWKQSNNGVTYIASSTELSHLGRALATSQY